MKKLNLMHNRKLIQVELMISYRIKKKIKINHRIFNKKIKQK